VSRLANEIRYLSFFGGDNGVERIACEADIEKHLTELGDSVQQGGRIDYLRRLEGRTVVEEVTHQSHPLPLAPVSPAVYRLQHTRPSGFGVWLACSVISPAAGIETHTHVFALIHTHSRERGGGGREVGREGGREVFSSRCGRERQLAVCV
jgi:hypothetical protein